MSQWNWTLLILGTEKGKRSWLTRYFCKGGSGTNLHSPVLWYLVPKQISVPVHVLFPWVNVPGGSGDEGPPVLGSVLLGALLFHPSQPSFPRAGVSLGFFAWDPLRRVGPLLFVCLWPHHAACRILVPWPGIEPVPPAVEAWSLNHWASREVPELDF